MRGFKLKNLIAKDCDNYFLGIYTGKKEIKTGEIWVSKTPKEKLELFFYTDEFKGHTIEDLKKIVKIMERIKNEN